MGSGLSVQMWMFMQVPDLTAKVKGNLKHFTNLLGVGKDEGI